VLSAILPFLVVAGVLVAVHQFFPTPRGGNSETVTQLENKLIKAGDPQVVILGNSLTHAGLDEHRLAKLLRMPVAKLTVPHSQTPAWFAVLKNRVYGNGYQPRLVIVANTVHNIVGMDEASPQDHVRLVEQMGPDEPEIEAKVFTKDGQSPLARKLLENRERGRRVFLDNVRDISAGLIWGWRVEGDNLMIRGRNAAQDALDDTFETDEVNLGFAQTEHNRRQKQEFEDEHIDASMVPELVELAHSNDAHIVFLKMPVSPGSAVGELANPDTIRDLVDFLNEVGAGWIDPKMTLGPSMFQDTIHLTKAGQAMFTEQVGKDLVRIGATRRGELAQAVAPYAPPKVTRIGELPVLTMPSRAPKDDSCARIIPALNLSNLGNETMLGMGFQRVSPLHVTENGTEMTSRLRIDALYRECKPGTYAVGPQGVLVVPAADDPDSAIYEVTVNPELSELTPKGAEYYWVHPGTTLRLDFEEAWDTLERGPFVASIQVQPFGAPSTHAFVRMNNQKPVFFDSNGGRAMATIKAPAPDGAWSFEVSSPEDGPYMAVLSLSLGARSPEVFLDVEGATKGVVVDLIGRNPDFTSISYDTGFLELPYQPELTWHPDGRGIFDIPRMSHLSDVKTNRCSPLAVVENGKPLPNRRVKCEELPARPGSVCHPGRGLHVMPSKGPKAPQDRKYKVVLLRTPTQSCKTKRWLLPGDRAVAKVDRWGLKRLYRGARTLELSGKVLSEKDNGKMKVRLLVNGDLWLQAMVDVNKLEEGVRLPLEDRVPPTAKKVALELHNSENAFILVQRASLVEEDAKSVRVKKRRPL